MPGTSTFPVEATNVSRHGLWLLVGDEELFLPFEHICTGRCSTLICLSNRFERLPRFPSLPGVGREVA